MLCYYLSLFLISVYFVLSDYMFGSGSMEFVVPLADSSTFFPISVCFMATDTFSDLKVCLHFDFNCSCVFIVLCEMMFQNDLVEPYTHLLTWIFFFFYFILWLGKSYIFMSKYRVSFLSMSSIFTIHV